jgi:hypothetical protein
LITNWLDGHPTRGDINNYVNLVESGADTILQVDRNGPGGGGVDFVTVGVLENVTGLDAAALLAGGHLIMG